LIIFDNLANFIYLCISVLPQFDSTRDIFSAEDIDGKIGDTYSLEVVATPNVTLFFSNFFDDTTVLFFLSHTSMSRVSRYTHPCVLLSKTTRFAYLTF
jgi:hypothetical protein